MTFRGTKEPRNGRISWAGFKGPCPTSASFQDDTMGSRYRNCHPTICPKGATHTSPGQRPGNPVRENWCVLKEHRIGVTGRGPRRATMRRSFRTRVYFPGGFPEFPPWAGMRCPVSAANRRSRISARQGSLRPAGRVRWPRFPHLALRPHPSRYGSGSETTPRRPSRHCSWARWPRLSSLAFGPHPSSHGSKTASTYPVPYSKDVRRDVR